jgi:hypothetical protein
VNISSRTVNHEHADALARGDDAAFREEYAHTSPCSHGLVVDLKIRDAFKDVKRLEHLDVVVGTRLKAGLAVLLDHLERLIGIADSDFDDASFDLA